MIVYLLRLNNRTIKKILLFKLIFDMRVNPSAVCDLLSVMLSKCPAVEQIELCEIYLPITLFGTSQFAQVMTTNSTQLQILHLSCMTFCDTFLQHLLW